jgi:hypothetical protein
MSIIFWSRITSHEETENKMTSVRLTDSKTESTRHHHPSFLFQLENVTDHRRWRSSFFLAYIISSLWSTVVDLLVKSYPHNAVINEAISLTVRML